MVLKGELEATKEKLKMKNMKKELLNFARPEERSIVEGALHLDGDFYF